MNETDLRAAGFVRLNDGVWFKPLRRPAPTETMQTNATPPTATTGSRRRKISAPIESPQGRPDALTPATHQNRATEKAAKP